MLSVNTCKQVFFVYYPDYFSFAIKRFTMKSLLFALILTSTSMTGFTQKVIDVGKNNLPNTGGLYYTVSGVPVSNAKYVRVVEGSPFYNESWTWGKIILSGGKPYDSILLRLNLMENNVHYQSTDGEELIATTPLRSIVLQDPVTGKKIQFDNSDYIKTTAIHEAGWYQLLDSGLATGYKRYLKTIRENKPYGSATYEQTIVTSVRYYLMTQAVFTQIKKIKQLPELLQDKKEQLIAFINLKNLSGKTDEDYALVIAYYNSLYTK